MESSFDEIIVGTNEEFILGYQLSYKDEEHVNLEQSFSNHAHIGRVKQVAVCKKFLVTGSTDEFIKIFDLHSRKEIGSLNCHEGTINCLVYHESGFLFSTSDDGVICITDVEKWKLRKELKGHIAPVTGIAVHPSGKLGLSISKDKRLMTWDLMKGKRAYMAGLKKAGEIIKWSPDGSHYLISSSNTIDIYSIEHGNIVHTIDFKNNIHCFRYLTDNLLIVGGENKNLIIYDLKSNTEVVQWEAHETRTKCLLLLSSDSEELIRFASASSDGFIKIWNMNISVSSPPRLIGCVNTKSRIICIALKHISSSSTCSEFEHLENELSNQVKKTVSSSENKNISKKLNKKLGNKNIDLKNTGEINLKIKNINGANKVALSKKKTEKFNKLSNNEKLNKTLDNKERLSPKNKKDKVAQSKKKTKNFNKTLSNNEKSNETLDNKEKLSLKNKKDNLRSIQKTVRFKKTVKRRFIQPNK